MTWPSLVIWVPVVSHSLTPPAPTHIHILHWQKCYFQISRRFFNSAPRTWWLKLQVLKKKFFFPFLVNMLNSVKPCRSPKQQHLWRHINGPSDELMFCHVGNAAWIMIFNLKEVVRQEQKFEVLKLICLCRVVIFHSFPPNKYLKQNQSLNLTIGADPVCGWVNKHPPASIRI